MAPPRVGGYERGELDDRTLEQIQEQARTRVTRAVDAARAADDPAPEEAYAHVFAD